VGYILVTNDDGVDSPALLPLVRAVERLAPVRVVCPARERSWIGKAITRWEEIAVESVEREGVEITAVHGFPADCTNLAVHSLFPDPPELVVAGVNIGLNTGLGFFLSSGTVGAAMEAWIAGLPALAFSVGRPGSDREWKKEEWARKHGPDLWKRAAEISADIVRGVREAGFPSEIDLITVNFPVEARLETQRVVTRLAQVGYDGLFRRKAEGIFVHDFAGAIRDGGDLDGTDVSAVRNGWVSITPVSLAHTAELSPEFHEVLRARSG
jgi:5'-nucleotidase